MTDRPWESDPIVYTPRGEREPGAMDFFARGLTSVPGAPMDVLNWAASKFEDFTGLGGISSDEPFLGSRYIARNMEAPDPIIAGAVNRAGRALGADDDIMNPYWLSFGVAPEDAPADTLGKRTAEGAGLAAGSIIPGAGVARTLKAGGPVARGVGETISRPFINTPVRAAATELVAGAGAGAGGYVAEKAAYDAGVNPNAARMVGELVGGLTAAVAPGAVLRGGAALARRAPITGAIIRAGRAALLPFTEGGARIRAGRRLQSLSGAPEADAAAITGKTISGLTPAQETGNPRLMALERAILDTDATLDREFAARSAEGADALRAALREPAGSATPRDAQDFFSARRDYLRGLIEQRVLQAEEAAEQALSRLAPAMKETEASIVVRREMEAALDAARAQEGELWALVPDDEIVSTARAKEALAAVRARLGRAQHEDIPDEAVRFLDPERNTSFGAEESVKEMHALYSKLREVGRQARSREQRNRAKIAGEIAEAVLADIEAVEAAGAPLQAARVFTREMREIFSQGRVGKILGFEATGGATVAPELTLGTSVGRGGTEGAVSTDELRRATAGSKDADAAMRDFLRRRFTDASDKAKFLSRNAELLDRFPDLKAEMSEAVGAGQFVSDAKRVVSEGMREAGKASEVAFIDAPVSREFQAVFHARDPQAAARSLLRRAQGDETGQAVRGLKASALDYLMPRGELSANNIRAALTDPRSRAALNEILEPREMAAVGRVLRELEIHEQAAGRLPGVGGVMNDPVNTVISFIGRTFGARMGAKAGEGTSGASLLTAGFASKRVQGILRGLTNDRAEQLLRDSIQDPELFKALLIQADSPGRAAQVERRLVEWLGATGGQATEEIRGREPLPVPWESDPVIYERGGQEAPGPGEGPRGALDGDASIALAGARAKVPDVTLAAIRASQNIGPIRPIMLARTFVGTNEKRDAGIISAFIRKMTGQQIDPQQTPWCAAFVNAVLRGAGVDGTGSLSARSFMEFGEATTRPQVGDVAVFWRESPNSGKGHVGFYAGRVTRGGREYIRVLGGNQDNSVNEKLYPASQLLGYRRPPTLPA